MTKQHGWTPATFGGNEMNPRPFDTCAICGRRNIGRWWQRGDVRAFRCDWCADFETLGRDDPTATNPEGMSRAELIRRHKRQAENYRQLLHDFDKLRLEHSGAAVKIAVLEMIERTRTFSEAAPEPAYPQCSRCGRRIAGWFFTPLSYFCFECKPVTESWEYKNLAERYRPALRSCERCESVINKATARIKMVRKGSEALALKLTIAKEREAKLWKRVQNLQADESRWHDQYVKERDRGARIEKELAEARARSSEGRQATARPDPGLPFCGCRVKHVEDGREGLVLAVSWSCHPYTFALTEYRFKVRWDDGLVTEIRDPALLQIIERPAR